MIFRYDMLSSFANKERFMAAPSQSAGFRIEKHQTGFLPGESCLICSKNETVEPVVENSETEFLGKFRIQVITRPLADKELVHLSCHPNQPYHHKCIKQWITNKASCPLDRRQVNPLSPSVLSPDSPTALKVSGIASNIFFKMG